MLREATTICVLFWIGLVDLKKCQVSRDVVGFMRASGGHVIVVDEESRWCEWTRAGYVSSPGKRLLHSTAYGTGLNIFYSLRVNVVPPFPFYFLPC